MLSALCLSEEFIRRFLERGLWYSDRAYSIVTLTQNVKLVQRKYKHFFFSLTTDFCRQNSPSVPSNFSIQTEKETNQNTKLILMHGKQNKKGYLKIFLFTSDTKKTECITVAATRVPSGQICCIRVGVGGWRDRSGDAPRDRCHVGVVHVFWGGNGA